MDVQTDFDVSIPVVAEVEVSTETDKYYGK